MNSVFDTDKMISSFFDLKGSSVGRNAKPGEAVKKDNDVRAMIQNDPNSAFMMSPNRRKVLREQIIQDCNFLKSMKIFDYSMLIGIHYVPTHNNSASDTSIKGFTFRRNFQENRAMKSCQSVMSETSLGGSMQKRPFQSMVARIDASPPNADSGLRLNNIGMHLDKTSNRLSLVKNHDQTYVRSIDIMDNHDSESKFPDDSTLQKELIIEQSYWPFHRYYQVNGEFRKEPMDNIFKTVSGAQKEDIDKVVQIANCASCFGNSKNSGQESDDSGHSKVQLSDFVEPISNRKDCGITMDNSSIDLPIKMTIDDQQQECDGKIFYMGIIDILQQFNVRKRGEASLKKLSGMKGASCIHPDLYADRFIQFFDEYTQQKRKTESES